MDRYCSLWGRCTSSCNCRLQINSDYFSLLSILRGYSAAAGGRTALLAQWQLEDHDGGI
jgi:hypothetical protein